MLFSENPHFKILTLCTLCLKIVEDFDKQSLINQGINNFIRELQDFLLPAAENGTFRFNYKWDLNTGHSSNPTI